MAKEYISNNDINIDKNDFLCYFGYVFTDKKEIIMNCESCRISSPIKKYKSHTHDYLEIVCQLEGSAETRVGDKSFTFSEGEVMIIPPNVPHRGCSSEPFKDLSLEIRQTDLNEFRVLTDYGSEIVSLISIIAKLYMEQSGNYEPVVDSLIEALCQLIKYRTGSSQGSPSVEWVKKEIYDNLSNTDYDLAATIAKTGFDKDYFRRCFKKETGKTPVKYLTDIRINNAKQLLADSKPITVGAIAQSCGFADSLYFSTCFKKNVGLSPLAYRKSILSSNK